MVAAALLLARGSKAPVAVRAEGRATASVSSDESLPERVPVALKDGGIGYIDRDSLFGVSPWPRADELGGREGVPVTDADGNHLGWFAPDFGALSDDQAAVYAKGQDPFPNPIVSSSSHDGMPTGFGPPGG